MASTSATRWRLACDACEAGAWLGPGGAGFDAWCESCQSPHPLAATPAPLERCPRCGSPLSAWPRFVELWGELQQLDAVLGAWAGDFAPLAKLLPERPRFITALTPPKPEPAEPATCLALLEAVAHGHYRAALALAAVGGGTRDESARVHAALAIAHERTGEPAAALAAWSAVLALGEDERARLARGALLARAGRFAAAGADSELAGDSYAARWNRAALLLHAAVSASGTLPDAGVMARARAEAGEASAYWSDATVGRLLWSLLIERALAGRPAPEYPRDQLRERARTDTAPPPALSGSTHAALRAAESEFEHSTFWDRAMMLVGWARLGAAHEVARIAAPLAREQSAALLAEPALRGPALAVVHRAVAAARSAMDMDEPHEARHTLVEAFARDDLHRFRIPCAACGRGTVGVEEVAENVT